MALVAYSDDSDLGSEVEDVEENENCTVNVSKPGASLGSIDSNVSGSSARSGSGQLALSSVQDIVDIDDEDESFVRGKPSLLASIPAAVPVDFAENGADVGEVEDELIDVPTVDTWKVTADIKKGSGDSQPHTSITSKSNAKSAKTKEKKKVKIFIPALSEFDDDDEEEEKNEEPERKKMKPSSKGTGLFSVLPEPKNISVKESKRPLIPHVLTKAPPVQKPIKPKPSVQNKSTVEDYDYDDDKDGETMDFFSLGESPAKLGGVATIPIPAENVKVPIADVHVERHQAYEDQYVSEDARNSKYKEQISSEPVGHPHQEELSELPQEQERVSENPYNMDQEAMIRLMGKRRGKNEEVNFIDVNADDALLTRDEWMTKALSEEKPSHSFSKKKEGLPSQKQKQKHQITYLAYQAKERELELKNNWAQNRMTKMQTQAKYGF